MTLTPNVPPELLEKLAADKCVAYVGAGLSAGAGLPLWDKTLRQMIEWSAARLIPMPDAAELDRLIDEKDFLTVADTIIERMGDSRFREFITGVFRRAGLAPTETHKLFPEIPFAAVLTSNYDKFVESAYAVVRNGASVPVYTHLDRAELSGALQSGEFHILKTHGDVDRINSIVLSRRQYRNLMHDNEAYKKYLEQTLSSKSILFLGFSLTDPDLLLILDELRVCFGDDTPPHFALMDKTNLSSVKADRFRRDYNIHIVEYAPSAPSHPEVGEFLREIIKRTPKRFYQNLEKAKEELENLDSHYKLVATTENEFVIKEKFPGAAQEKPLGYGFTLAFDTKTEEGRAAKEAWDNFEKTGEQTTLSSPFVQNLRLPEVLAKLVNFKPETLTMTVGTYQSGEKFGFRIIATADDGTSAAIDNIQLEKIAQGDAAITLDNEKQNHFFKVRFVMNLADDNVNISFEYNRTGKTIHQALVAERFLAILAKGGTITIEGTESGMPFGKGASFPPGLIESPEPLFLEVLEALMTLQRKTGATFAVPRNLTLDEAEKILEAAQYARTGRGDGTLTMTFEFGREEIERIVNGNGSFNVQHYAESIYAIQGQKISLGAVWIVGENLIVSDEEKERLRKQLDEQPDAENFDIELRSSPENPGQVYYLSYLPPDEFEKLHTDAQFRQFTLGYLLKTLFNAAMIEHGTVDLKALISFIETAAEQKTDDGKPFNMLRRCTADELNRALEPLLPRFNQTQKNEFMIELVRIGILEETG